MTGALRMPSNYVLMDEDEMTYVEGGYNFLCRPVSQRCSTATYAIFTEVFIAVAAVGLSAAATLPEAVASATVQKIISASESLKSYVNGSVVRRMIYKGVQASGLTIGLIIAYAMDANDAGGLDGYVQWVSY